MYFIDKKQQETTKNEKIVVFAKLAPFLRHHGSEEDHMIKSFLPKFVQIDDLGTFEVWGTSEKPFLREYLI